MSLLEELKALDVDVHEGLDRVMGDNSLYEMMLGMFISSVNDNPIGLEDFGGDNLDALIQKIHMFKGITGNLAMTPLFTKYTDVLGLLRAGRAGEAKAGFEEILPVQAKIMDCIQRHTSA